MTNLPVETLLPFLNTLADAAAAETRMRFRTNTAVFNKLEAGFDPVTDADREAERAIRRLVAEHYPDHGFLGEEDGETKGTSPYRWVVDPVDGTRAFVCGVPTWTTLIGLEKDGVPIAG